VTLRHLNQSFNDNNNNSTDDGDGDDDRRRNKRTKLEAKDLKTLNCYRKEKLCFVTKSAGY